MAVAANSISRESLRRQEDIERDLNCKEHEEKMDTIKEDMGMLKQKLSKQEGWFKAAAGFLSLAVIMLGWFGTIIIGQLSSIDKALNGSNVISERHTQQIENLSARTYNIEEQHRFEMQQKGKR